MNYLKNKTKYLFAIFFAFGFLMGQNVYALENLCAVNNQACMANEANLGAWLSDIQTANPNGEVDGVPVDEITLDDIKTQSCRLFGDTNDFCFEYDDEVLDLIVSELDINNPLDDVVDTSLITIINEGDERCFIGPSDQASTACEQEDEGLGCTLDQDRSSGNLIAYCTFIQQYGAGQECGPSYNANQNGDPRGGQTSTAYANSLASCQAQRNEYVLTGGSNPCTSSRLSGPSAGGIYTYKQCFDATGLLKKTSQQIADEAQILEDLRNAEIAAARAAVLAAQQAAFDGTRFGGAEGGLVPECGTDGTGSICGWLDFIQLINNIINFIIWAAAIIMVIVLILSGFKLVTAQGKASELAGAKDSMKRAIIGFCVVLLAWLLVNAVMESLLRSDFLNDDVSNLLER